MKFLFTIVLALFTAHLLTAQHIAVKSFRMLENDSDPQTKFPVEDQNGDVCALIKVMTTETGFDWDGGQLGIRKILQKTGEIWIYVPFGAKRITISHAVFGVLRGYDYPLEIKEAAVYEMVLTISKAPTAVLVVSSDPSGADVYIDGKPKGTTPFVSNEMRIGAYQLRLEKTGFETVSKKIELQEGKPTIIKETLRKKEEEKITAQQHIAVKSFRVLENDLDARVSFPVEDQDGKICALIKVMTTETGFDWDGDQLGIRKILQKKGEIWIYVPSGAKRITISHAVFGVLRGYAYPLEIKEAAVYEMVLTTGKR